MNKFNNVSLNKHLKLERNNNSIVFTSYPNSKFDHQCKIKKQKSLFKNILIHDETYKKFNNTNDSIKKNSEEIIINNCKYVSNVPYNKLFYNDIYKNIIERSVDNNRVIKGVIHINIKTNSNSKLVSPSFDYMRIQGNKSLIKTKTNLKWKRSITDLLLNKPCILKGTIKYKFEPRNKYNITECKSYIDNYTSFK